MLMLQIPVPTLCSVFAKLFELILRKNSDFIYIRAAVWILKETLNYTVHEFYMVLKETLA